MSLRNRLNRLEDQWGGRSCPTCGKSEDTVVVRTSWDSDSESEDERERCPTCWEPPIRVTLTWND
jgi:hypothetical protein